MKKKNNRLNKAVSVLATLIAFYGFVNGFITLDKYDDKPKNVVVTEETYKRAK